MNLDDETQDDAKDAPVEGKPPTKARQGDQVRPICPNCSTEKKPVKLVSTSSRNLFTWYKCPRPNCSYTYKLPRPNIAQVLGRERRDEGDFSAR